MSNQVRRIMDKWRVSSESDTDEQGNEVTWWAVNHYVGGEYGWYLDNWLTSEDEAIKRRDYLNSSKVYSYCWVDKGEGDYHLDVVNQDEINQEGSDDHVSINSI